MTRNERIGIIVVLVIFVIAISTLILTCIINTAQAIEITILFALVLATFIYAKRTSEIASATKAQAQATREQADASVKMADGMTRPVIDFKRDTAKADIALQTSEAYDAIHEETSHGLSCILCNVGVGSAIDVRSFIEHPERGRLPWEFGTIASRGKTQRWILSIRHESNRTALVAFYEDIFGRTLESSREVSIDKENHNWKLGRLKVVPVKEVKSHD